MTATTTPTVLASTAKAQPSAEKKATSAKDTPKMVTLVELAREMKIPARDARILLRLAAKQTRQYPNLGKEHVARQPWSWTPGSKGLEEAARL
jgi:hypothetical protein